MVSLATSVTAALYSSTGLATQNENDIWFKEVSHDKKVMVRFQYASDLHMEFHPAECNIKFRGSGAAGEGAPADVLLLAGDIGKSSF